MIKKTPCFVLLAYICFSCTNTSKKDNIEVEKKEMKNNFENIIQMHSEMVFSNKVEILIPVGFITMKKEEAVKIYPDYKRRPDIIFKNTEGSVNISFQHTHKKALISDIPGILEQLTVRYKKTPAIEFLNSRIENIKGKDYVLLEFLSQGNNNKVYNLMLVTSLDDRVMMCAFTCAMPIVNEWKEKGYKIMKTIRIL